MHIGQRTHHRVRAQKRASADHHQLAVTNVIRVETVPAGVTKHRFDKLDRKVRYNPQIHHT